MKEKDINEMTNVALIGMMGTFKSSSGKIAAKKLSMDFFDTDSAIEKQCGKKIKEIFEERGEGYFREIEKEVVLAASKLRNTLISCGGGVVLAEENMQNLKNCGTVILLTASAEAICRRVKNTDGRPLLNQASLEENILEIISKRRFLYEKYADFKIENTNKTTNETADCIVEYVCKKRLCGV